MKAKEGTALEKEKKKPYNWYICEVFKRKNYDVRLTYLETKRSKCSLDSKYKSEKRKAKPPRFVSMNN